MPAPRDIAFRGVVRMVVDASDTTHKIVNVHETIPVQAAGPMTLLYPQWEVASHSATVQVARLAGLIIRADDQRIDWTRDAIDMHAFHIDVPSGATTLDLDYQYLASGTPREGPPEMSRDILAMQWHTASVYPAGWFARDITVQASVKLPAGFQYATALTTDSFGNDVASFKPTTLEVLYDSPVYAGRYLKRVDLAPKAATPVTLNLFGDNLRNIDIGDAQITRYRAAVAEIEHTFASTHFDHYDLLVSLSDVLPSSGGTEHARSGEVGLPADYLGNESGHLPELDILWHEFIHSWNGLFRRPADMWTANANQPVRNSLLWVYEGQSEFWGRVIAARAGIRSIEATKDLFAIDAARMQARPGRRWKSLQDSNNDPVFMAKRAVAWRDWQRREDYYLEGPIFWLNIDSIIRERTGDTKGLDDFAKAFFGVNAGSQITTTYTFDDVCTTLNNVLPFDWSNFLRKRLDTHDDDGLLDGLAHAGYRLIFTTEPSDFYRQLESEDDVADLSYSIGLTVKSNGTVPVVAWNGPAFKSGLSNGAKITTINGAPFSVDLLKATISNAANGSINLGFKLDGQDQIAHIDYHGSLRYPHLQRISESKDRLVPLLQARRINPVSM
ncbi:M61 family metallopeptidase [Pseudolysobacter antarcticus]|uniref:M61 family metallopeptidase n=1 Tax=Pseudolysobacter antarcticus TaxID=2511995 RepID=UPI0013EAE4F1|nr:M61 family metallopeptidase [Pseudolysobacter antarcticus]